VGHAGPVRILTAALAAGRVPHALLLHGPAGVGKGTAAERLAAALLCGDPRRRPCGACDACRRIAHGDPYDVVRLEPDGAWIKVEQVRALTDLMRAGPERAVVLIDPADAMNDQTANALLKTLEEPPPGWTLVLVTARPERLLPTLRSRCQAVRFGRLDAAGTRRVLAAHGVPEAELPVLARIADGAPGAVLGAGMPAPELAREYADAIAVLDPAALHSPTTIFSAAEAWGRDPERTRRFLRWVQMWVSEALCPAEGTSMQTAPNAHPAPAGDGDDAARWGARFRPGFLAEFTLAVQEAEERLERNINRPTAIEALLVTLHGALAEDAAPKGTNG
jgi:DNA polymerase-3 subunit delta'